jgi:hypothetical protein
LYEETTNLISLEAQYSSNKNRKILKIQIQNLRFITSQHMTGLPSWTREPVALLLASWVQITDHFI